jgi:branched-chain amino acid transport system permease protein
MNAAASSATLMRYRIRWAEPIWWLAALSVFFLFPSYLYLATSVLVMALFALSLDIILGFAGVVSLGHALFYGIGAFTAGLLATNGWNEPVSAVIAGGGVAAALAAILGPFVLRLTGLPLVMVTLALGVIFFEIANKASSITGGVDGLYGLELDPIFGIFEWTIFGHTQYLYVLGWLFILFIIARRLVASPFGVALAGIRENRLRMKLIGAPVLRHLVLAYAISGFYAGVAGALSAQATAFVGIEVFSVETSIDVLVMLVVGGIGHLYGALLGAPVYMLVKEFSQQWNPYYWMFFIGALLIVVTGITKGGLVGILRRLASAFGSKEAGR